VHCSLRGNGEPSFFVPLILERAVLRTVSGSLRKRGRECTGRPQRRLIRLPSVTSAVFRVRHTRSLRPSVLITSGVSVLCSFRKRDKDRRLDQRDTKRPGNIGQLIPVAIDQHTGTSQGGACNQSRPSSSTRILDFDLTYKGITTNTLPTSLTMS